MYGALEVKSRTPLEKLLDSSCVYKDFVRLGLLSLNNTNINRNILANDFEDLSAQFRLCTLNINYQIYIITVNR